MSTEKSTQVTVNIDSSADEREKLEAIQKVIDTYKDKEGCLIAVLHLAQEIYGYLPLEVQRLIADGMGVTLSYVSSVVTFYSYFSMIPRAEHAIKICLGTACYVKGSQKVLDKLCSELGVEVGQTTKDGRFTLRDTRCLGACGLAPAMSIDDTVYKRVNPDHLEHILAQYTPNKEGEAV